MTEPASEPKGAATKEEAAPEHPRPSERTELLAIRGLKRYFPYAGPGDICTSPKPNLCLTDASAARPAAGSSAPPGPSSTSPIP